MPLTILAYVLGGAGVGGGVAAAAATSSMISWTIYGLTVEEDQGSWVLTIRGGTDSSWAFVEPGGPLPERDWLDWPAPRR